MLSRRSQAIVWGVMTAALASACAARAPVLNVPPRYPQFAFPSLPAELSQSGEADEHQRAWFYLQAGDLGNAQQEFAEVLNREPGFYPAEAGLGYVHLAGQEYETAVFRFDAALARAPRYVPALLGRGEAYLGANRLDQAIESFEAALAIQADLGTLPGRLEELRFTRMMSQVADARRAVQAGRYAQARIAYERVLEASPESAFLHLELAQVERREGNLVRALELARRAAALDSSDATPVVLEGEIHESSGDLAAAEGAYRRALALDPSDDVQQRLAGVLDRLRLAALPPQYGRIPMIARVTRGDLAALLGVRFEALLERARGLRTVIVTDTRNHWANGWINAVTAAGVIEANVNHQFQPERAVTRSELAEAVTRVLDLIAPNTPVEAVRWRTARPTFADMGSAHLNYPAAAQAVSAGVMTALDGNTFQPGRVVTGPDVIEAIDHLEALVRSVG